MKTFHFYDLSCEFIFESMRETLLIFNRLNTYLDGTSRL